MAGQDIKKRIEAGGVTHINVGGDYLFLKFADRPVNVIITGGPSGGSRVTMEAGDKYRPGQFQAFEVENPDADNPAQIIFTVGTGDYNRQIVQGEVMIEPGLRSADGTFKTDTRQTITIDLLPSSLITEAYVAGDLIATGTPVTNMLEEPDTDQGADINAIAFDGPNNTIVFHKAVSGFYSGGMVFYDQELNIIGQNTLSPGVPGNVPVVDTGWSPELGYFGLRNNRIYQYVESDDSKIDLGLLPGEEVQSICHVTADNSYWGLKISFPTKVQIYSADRQSITKTIDLTNIGATTIRYNRVKDEMWVIGDGRLTIIDRATGAIVKDGSLSNFITPGTVKNTCVVARNNDGIYFDDLTPTSPQRVAFLNYETKPKITSRRPGCSGLFAMVRQDQAPQILADFSAAEIGGGVVITGELIRAALEWHYRRAAPEDYLDHVYYLDLGRTGSGEPFKAISTGNATFDRANVADDFDALLPGRITLTIDNEMTLGGPL